MQNSHESIHAAMDMVTLGERGQVVIPAVIRDTIGLKPGDKLMVFTKHAEVICMVPASSMRHLVDVLNAQLAEIDTEGPSKNNQSTKEAK
ncbi:MAG TPA: AbrB/MazE/SpoVT family DNA-binding domain-containing protein [Candidatus Saccharimonadia bacterium]|nr:AbrB/MazE/SpoVT family DNA-binding domain-containing protein [Candidatus Saccharimonadia bacterium]